MRTAKKIMERYAHYFRVRGLSHDEAWEAVVREAVEAERRRNRAAIDTFDALARKYNYPGSHGPQELRDAFEALCGEPDFRCNTLPNGECVADDCYLHGPRKTAPCMHINGDCGGGCEACRRP